MLNLTKALELTIRAKEDPAALYELESMINDATYMEIAKSKGNLKAFTALKRILEKTKKDKPYNPGLHGAWIDKLSEKQYVCNGYYLIEINNPFEGLPQSWGGAPPLDAEYFFEDAEDFKTEISIDAKAIKLKLKQAQAEAKALGKKKLDKHDFGTIKLGQSWFFAAQLVDILSVLGEEVSVHGMEGSNEPCIITSTIGRAFLMPVLVEEEE